jgi:hypothetical protein
LTPTLRAQVVAEPRWVIPWNMRTIDKVQIREAARAPIASLSERVGPVRRSQGSLPPTGGGGPIETCRKPELVGMSPTAVG